MSLHVFRSLFLAALLAGGFGGSSPAFGQYYGYGGYSDPWSRTYEAFDPNPAYGLPAYYYLLPPAAFGYGATNCRPAVRPVVTTVPQAGAWTNGFVEFRGRSVPTVHLAPH